MPLIARTSLPTFLLVEDDTLRQWLRLDCDQDVETLDLLLAGATDYLEGLTGRVLAAANYTITWDILAPCLPITLSPLNSVAGVVAQLGDGTEQALTADTDYRLALQTALPSLTILDVPANTQAVTLTCNAGYQNPAAVPPVLQQAAAVLVAAGYDNRTALDPRTIDTVNNLVGRYRAVGL